MNRYTWMACGLAPFLFLAGCGGGSAPKEEAKAPAAAAAPAVDQATAPTVDGGVSFSGTARTKTYTCRNVGVNCDWKVRGNSDDEVMRKIKDHAREVHKMDPIPPDLEPKVLAAIREER